MTEFFPPQNLVLLTTLCGEWYVSIPSGRPSNIDHLLGPEFPASTPVHAQGIAYVVLCIFCIHIS